jgi:hypothetical protein
VLGCPSEQHGLYREGTRAKFIAGLSTTAIWSLAARAQQPAKVKRIAVDHGQRRSHRSAEEWVSAWNDWRAENREPHSPSGPLQGGPSRGEPHLGHSAAQRGGPQRGGPPRGESQRANLHDAVVIWRTSAGRISRLPLWWMSGSGSTAFVALTSAPRAAGSRSVAFALCSRAKRCA